MRPIPWLAGALLALASAAPAQARLRPMLDARLGATTAIGGGVAEGGLAAGLAALWPVTSGIRSGLEFGADDFGASIGRLRDPHDGSDLGAVAAVHREALSVLWRLDGEPPAWRGYAPWLSAGWGTYRFRDDHIGRVTGRLTAAGIFAGGGVRHAIGASLDLGVTARWHRLFDQTTGRWLSVGADLAWR